MDKAEFMEGIHLIQNAYNQKFSTEKLKLYYENLQDMDKEQYIKNIKQLIKNSDFDFSQLYANRGRKV